MKMGWCDKYHRALFVVIHNRPWPVTTSALNHVFFLYGDVENITRFQTMGEFHAREFLFPKRCCECILHASRALYLWRLWVGSLFC